MSEHRYFTVETTALTIPERGALAIYCGEAPRRPPWRARRCRMNRWIKQPGPGQFRGEGEWQPFEGTDEEWENLRGTGFLPTHEGEEKPE